MMRLGIIDTGPAGDGEFVKAMRQALGVEIIAHVARVARVALADLDKAEILALGRRRSFTIDRN